MSDDDRLAMSENFEDNGGRQLLEPLDMFSCSNAADQYALGEVHEAMRRVWVWGEGAPMTVGDL